LSISNNRLVRRASFALCLLISAPQVLAADPPLLTVDSGRDVDLAYVDNTLVTLAFVQSRWTAISVGNNAESARCSVPGKAFFSSDRQRVISVSAGERSRLQVYAPLRCEVVLDVTLPRRVRDADVHEAAQRILISAQGARGLELFLYSTDGAQIAALGTARNAEVSFTPRGDMALNSDHGGGHVSAWSVADGAKLSPPVPDGHDPIFSGNGEALFATKAGVVQAMSGNVANVRNEPGEVLRGASHTGATLVLQAPNPAQPAFPKVRLLDTQNQTSIALGMGHIDATALSQDGSKAAIAIRAQRSNRITITQLQREGLFTP
jgi:hypothetical protein